MTASHRDARSRGAGPRGACPARPTGPDAGAASVLVVALVAVLAAGAVTFSLAAHALEARAGARAAADLAALAGAQAVVLPAGLVRGPALGDESVRACSVAAEVADANRAQLTGCAADAAGVVTVSVRTRAPIGSAESTSRAGPRPSRP